MAVDVPALIEWLPNSSNYEVSEPLLTRALNAAIGNVGSRCRWLGEGEDPADGTQASTDEWPEPVQTATLMIAADIYASRNRPGTIPYGEYVPKNYEAEKLVGPYLAIGVA